MVKKLPLLMVSVLILIVSIAIYAFINLFKHSQVPHIDQAGTDSYHLQDMIAHGDPSLSGSPSLSDLKTDSVTILSSGSFTRFDPVHYASGQALVYQTPEGPFLKLENFSTSNGPDLFVYLSSSPDINSIKSNLAESVSLGKLKSISGDQIYRLPDDFSLYPSVVIWCRAFSVNFSVATLQPL